MTRVARKPARSRRPRPKARSSKTTKPTRPRAKAISRSAANGRPAKRGPRVSKVRPSPGTRSDAAVRAHVVALLRGGQAHARFDDAVRGFPAELRGVVPDGAPHSAWQIVEHLRISLWDILEFTRDTKHVSPTFPAGYWPAGPNPPDSRAWDRALESIRSDTLAMERLVEDLHRDLVAQVPHPESKPHHTILREAMVAGVHMSYHLAELILLRRLLGIWPPA